MSKLWRKVTSVSWEKNGESLVVEFDQAKYGEFLSSYSKSPRMAEQYHRVSSETHSHVSSETSSKVVCINSTIFGRVARVARLNVS